MVIPRTARGGAGTHLLVAAGRRPRTGGLCLDDVGFGVGPGGEVVIGDAP